MSKIEFRVRPVSRYIVTKYEEHGEAASVSTVGEFPNQQSAEEVANAFASIQVGRRVEVNGNILPEHDIAGLLRNIAEMVETGRIAGVSRGLLVLEGEMEKPVFGLGATMRDPYELLDSARKSLDETCGELAAEPVVVRSMSMRRVDVDAAPPTSRSAPAPSPAPAAAFAPCPSAAPAQPG